MELLKTLDLLENAVKEEIKYLEGKELNDSTINTICLCGGMLRNIRRLRELQDKEE